MSKKSPKRRILLTNDDGFDAPGLTALIAVARQIAEEVWIVAPKDDHSGVAQAITLTRPLRCKARGDKAWSVDGMPADCVVLALSHFMKEHRPDFVLSGVNNGKNIGDDFNSSATMGAAFTSALHGVPSAGISLDRKSRTEIKWDTARSVLPDLLDSLMTEGWDSGHPLCINIPNLETNQITGTRWTHPASPTTQSFLVEERVDLRETPYFWIYPDKDFSKADEGSDYAALKRGEISITPLALSRGVDVMPTSFIQKTANDG